MIKWISTSICRNFIDNHLCSVLWAHYGFVYVYDVYWMGNEWQSRWSDFKRGIFVNNGIFNAEKCRMNHDSKVYFWIAMEFLCKLNSVIWSCTLFLACVAVSNECKTRYEACSLLNGTQSSGLQLCRVATSSTCHRYR